MLCNTAEIKLDVLAEQIFQTIVGIDVKPTTFEKEFIVDPKVAERLQGKYQLAPGMVLTVQVKEGRMMAQLTGQNSWG